MDKTLIRSGLTLCFPMVCVIALTLQTGAVRAAPFISTDTAGPSQGRRSIDELRNIFIIIDSDHFSMPDLMEAIKRNTRLGIFIEISILSSGHAIRMHGRVSVKELIDSAVKGKDWEVQVMEGDISIKRSTAKPRTVYVIVTDSADKRLPGASLTYAGAGLGMTNKDGYFSFQAVKGCDTVMISYVGYRSAREDLSGRETIEVQLKWEGKSLDVLNVISTHPERKPPALGDPVKGVGPFSIMSAGTAQTFVGVQAPGVLMLPKSGIPGSSVDLSVRGDNSLQHDGNLMITINGIPIYSRPVGAISLGNSGSVLFTSLGFFTGTINYGTSIIREADSLARYGVMGANGVIAFNTIRPDDTCLLQVDVTGGVSMPTRKVPLLDTKQYLQMRREAFRNDGIAPDPLNAPDLLSLDTTSNKDWNKTIFNGAAKYSQVNLFSMMKWRHFSYQAIVTHRKEGEILGDHPNNYLTTFLVSGGYKPDKRLDVRVTGIYSVNKNNQFGINQTALLYYIPNAPVLLDSSHRFVFTTPGGLNINNPLAYEQYSYDAFTRTAIGSLAAGYKLGKFELQFDAGYNSIDTRERSVIPSYAQDPASSPRDLHYAARTSIESYLLQARVTYRQSWRRFNFSATGGASQYVENDKRNAPTDTVGQTDAAGLSGNTVADYRNAGCYGYVEMDMDRRLFLNMTVRADASSRIAPSDGNFYSRAAGIAWLFRKLDTTKSDPSFFSSGKARLTYGVTGSDAIPDYGYQPGWQSVTIDLPSQLAGAIYPTAPANPSLSWQRFEKSSVGATLGFFKDQLILDVVYYRNYAKQLMVRYNLSLTAGFSYEYRNWPAVIRNDGLELSFTKRAKETSRVKWMSVVNLTIPRSTLVAYPKIEESPYAKTLIVGQSMSTVWLFKYKGINPLTGTYTFQDFDGDGKYTDADKKAVGKPGIRMYGNWTNSVQKGPWQMTVLLQGIVQTGVDYQRDIFYANAPGMFSPGFFSNQTTKVLDHWQKPGDRGRYQKFSTMGTSDAGKLIPFYINSTGILENASFLSLRFVTLSYDLPAKLLSRLHLKKSCRIYIQGQNLYTLTPYEDVDPSLQSGLICPLPKSIGAGILVNL